MPGWLRVGTALVLGLVVLPLAACEAGRQKPSTGSSTGGPTGAASASASGPSPRPAASVPFFGLDVPRADPTEARRVAGVLGCTPSVVSTFVKLDTVFTAASLRRLATDGATPFVTLEPWLQSMRSGAVHDSAFSLRSVADGSHDRQLTGIARAVAAYGGHVYLRYAHEMNGTWYPWATSVNGGSPGAYVAAWRHVHGVFAAAGATNVSWVWAPTAVGAGPVDNAALAASYPGSAYVDFVGLTGYAHGGTSARATFEPWVAAIVSFSHRPVVLAEIGADGAGKVQWIESLAPYLEYTPSIAGFIWFNTTPGTVGATGYYRIDNSAHQAAAMRGVLSSLNVSCNQQTEVTQP